MVKPTCRALCCMCAGCLSGVGTYLPGTVLQAVYAVSEPTSWALCGRGACCLSAVGTYLPGTVGQGCRLLKRCWNLPSQHCGAVVLAVYSGSEPTSRALLSRDAGCLSGVSFYLLSRLDGQTWILYCSTFILGLIR